MRLTGTGQTVGLAEFGGYDPNDIQTYESMAGIYPSVSLNNVQLDNFSTSSSNRITSETTLDIEQVIAMAPGLSAVIVFEEPGFAFEHVLDRMVSYEPRINQFSCSSGIEGSDTTADNYFIQMAMQGQSFFQASGDGDAYTSAIWWPGDDPYVTSVGGTTLTMNGLGNSYALETVWNDGFGGVKNGWFANGDGNWGSGGGVSTTYLIPYWQSGFITPANGGSTTMRNVPDVSAVAENIWGYVAKTTVDAKGTSFAAPLWAGFTALVNQQAARWSLPAVGFLNPPLYTNIGGGPIYAAAFHDITTGNNEWMPVGADPGSPDKFTAVSGYDLCTGWGTPQGLVLVDALLSGGTVWVDFNYSGATQNGTFSAPFKTLVQGENAVLAGGTIWIKTPGSSPETPTISKPLTIRVYRGPASLGD